MSDGDLLLKGILDNPADNTARLVYADWLEEQVEESCRDRATFIRKSMELEQFDGSVKRRTELTGEIRELFGKWGPEWGSDGWADLNLVAAVFNPNHIQVDGVHPAKRGAAARIRKGFHYWLSWTACDCYMMANSWFKHCPLTVVYMEDRQPHQGTNYSQRWIRGKDEWDNNNRAKIHPEVFDMLIGGKKVRQSMVYSDGIEAAKEALMLAYIRWGRKKAKLPFGVHATKLYA